MPRKYPAEVRRQVIELARSGTNVAQLAETVGMSGPTPRNRPLIQPPAPSTPHENPASSTLDIRAYKEIAKGNF